MAVSLKSLNGSKSQKLRKHGVSHFSVFPGEVATGLIVLF